MSKIDFVGVQTQSKLLDISAAANAMGISCINAVHNSITTGTAFTRVTSVLYPWAALDVRMRLQSLLPVYCCTIAIMWLSLQDSPSVATLSISLLFALSASL